MIIVNYDTKPINPSILGQIRRWAEIDTVRVERVCEVPLRDIPIGLPLMEIAEQAIEQAALSPAEWAEAVLNPPRHPALAACLLAALHQHLHFFVPVLRIRSTDWDGDDILYEIVPFSMYSARLDMHI